jgi:hypothetical protein
MARYPTRGLLRSSRHSALSTLQWLHSLQLLRDYEGSRVVKLSFGYAVDWRHLPSVDVSQAFDINAGGQLAKCRRSVNLDRIARPCQ